MHPLVIVGIIIVILLIVGFAIYKFRKAATAPVTSEVTVNTTPGESPKVPATVIDSATPTTVVTPSAPTTSEPTCADPAAYYYYYSPDVKAAGVDALAHWNSTGYKEGRKSCYPPPAAATVAGLTIGGKYSIRSDIGKYLTPNSGVVDAGGNAPTGWTIRAGSAPGTVRLQADNGQYANYFVRADPRIVKAEQVLMTAGADKEIMDWTPVQAGDQYGFSNGAGKFMTRCNGCGVLTNIITAHETGVNGWSSNFTLTPM